MSLCVDTVIAAARNAFVTPLGLAHDQWMLMHPTDFLELRKTLKVEGIGMINGIVVKPSLDIPKGEVRVVKAYEVR